MSAENIQAEMKGNKLVITVDISPSTVKNAPKSSSGKNRVVATTHGWLEVNSGPNHLPVARIGLNVIAK